MEVLTYRLNSKVVTSEEIKALDTMVTLLDQRKITFYLVCKDTLKCYKQI